MEDMNVKKRKLLFWLIIVIIPIIFCVYIDSCFEDTEKELIEDAEMVFQSAIQQDKAHREKGFLNDFHSEQKMTFTPSDSITISTEQYVKKIIQPDKKELSYEEKKYISDHMYLLLKNPIQVTRLDSLFKALLDKNNLSAETAIIYTAKGKSEYSNPDSTFYSDATSLNLVSIGNVIHLKGYVKFKVSFIFWKIPHISTIILIWLGIGFLLLAYSFLKWQEWKIFSALYVNLTEKSELAMPVPDSKQIFITKTFSDDMRIRDDLFFNKTMGEIKYKNNTIHLSKKSTTLLKHLFQGEDWFQTYESIKKNVWGNEDTTNDAVRNAVNRLNKELKRIPGFSVEKIPIRGLRICCEGKEYQINKKI